MAIVIHSDYERSSVKVSTSTVVGTTVSIRPICQISNDVVAGGSRWLEPSAKLTGVNGLTPTLRFFRMLNNTAGVEGGYHNPPWQSTRRPMFSYDRLTWTYFDNCVVEDWNGWVEFSHNTAFSQDTVYISRSRQISVHQIGDWLASLSHSSFGPAPSAIGYTPGSALSGFAAQSFIADQYSPQADEIGTTIPEMPLYAARINDTALTPRGGGAKQVAVLCSGVHGGEDLANFVNMRLVEYLLTETPLAIALRRQYDIFIYPMLNAPGRAGGGWRGSWTLGVGGADDLNRHFNDLGCGLEIVTKPRAAMNTDFGSTVPAWVLDNHGAMEQQYGLTVDPAMSRSLPFYKAVVAGSGLSDIDQNPPATPDLISGWFQSLGCPLSITTEVGDTYPMTDQDIEDYAYGMAFGLNRVLLGEVGVGGVVMGGSAATEGPAGTATFTYVGTGSVITGGAASTVKTTTTASTRTYVGVGGVTTGGAAATDFTTTAVTPPPVSVAPTANIFLGWPNRIDECVLSGGSWLLSLDKLKNRRYGDVARSNGLSPSSTKFFADLTQVRSLRAVALVNHNLSINAGWRIKLGTSTGAGDVYDSGWQGVWAMTFDSDMLEWSASNWWEGIDDDEYYTHPWLAVWPLGAYYNARYLTVEMSDASNPAGYVQAGRAFIGGGLIPTYNASFGLEEGWIDPSTIARTRNGTATFDVKRRRRYTRFGIDWLPNNDFKRVWEMQRRLGLTGEVLYLPDADSIQKAQRQGFLGGMSELTGLAYPFEPMRSGGFKIEEFI